MKNENTLGAQRRVSRRVAHGAHKSMGAIVKAHLAARAADLLGVRLRLGGLEQLAQLRHREVLDRLRQLDAAATTNRFARPRVRRARRGEQSESTLERRSSAPWGESERLRNPAGPENSDGCLARSLMKVI